MPTCNDFMAACLRPEWLISLCEVLPMKLLIEIRAAEGGEDAKLLVAEQAKAYRAAGVRSGL